MLRACAAAAARALSRAPPRCTRQLSSLADSDADLVYDVCIVGAGPAGLSAAIHLRQLALQKGADDLSVAVLEKGSEVGAHSLSGCVLETRALDELLPDWRCALGDKDSCARG